MKRICYIFFLFPLPLFAAESQGASGGFSLFASFIQMLFALVAVIGLILATYYGANRLMKSMPGISVQGKYIRLVETRALGPGKALLLIEVSGEYLLLSSSEKNISFLKKIDMLEEIEILDEPFDKKTFLSFLQRSKPSKPSAGQA